MLRTIFELDEHHDSAVPLSLEESRGLIKYKLSPEHFTPEAVAALNSASEQMLAGGQWFQIWHGEIVSMESPETPQGDDVARIHRGPLVHKAS